MLPLVAYKSGDKIEVLCYNPSTKVNEWLPGKFERTCDRDDKEYGVICELDNGGYIGLPFGAAPECVRPFKQSK